MSEVIPKKVRPYHNTKKPLKKVQMQISDSEQPSGEPEGAQRSVLSDVYAVHGGLLAGERHREHFIRCDRLDETGPTLIKNHSDR